MSFDIQRHIFSLVQQIEQFGCLITKYNDSKLREKYSHIILYFLGAKPSFEFAIYPIDVLEYVGNLSKGELILLQVYGGHKLSCYVVDLFENHEQAAEKFASAIKKFRSILRCHIERERRKVKLLFEKDEEVRRKLMFPNSHRSVFGKVLFKNGNAEYTEPSKQTILKMQNSKPSDRRPRIEFVPPRTSVCDLGPAKQLILQMQSSEGSNKRAQPEPKSSSSGELRALPSQTTLKVQNSQPNQTPKAVSMHQRSGIYDIGHEVPKTENSEPSIKKRRKSSKLAVGNFGPIHQHMLQTPYHHNQGPQFEFLLPRTTVCDFGPPQQSIQQMQWPDSTTEMSPHNEFTYPGAFSSNFEQYHQTMLQMQNAQFQFQGPQIQFLPSRNTTHKFAPFPQQAPQMLSPQLPVQRPQTHFFPSRSDSGATFSEMHRPQVQRQRIAGMHSPNTAYNSFGPHQNSLRMQNSKVSIKRQKLGSVPPKTEMRNFFPPSQQTILHQMQNLHPQILSQMPSTNPVYGFEPSQQPFFQVQNFGHPNTRAENECFASRTSTPDLKQFLQKISQIQNTQLPTPEVAFVPSSVDFHRLQPIPEVQNSEFTTKPSEIEYIPTSITEQDLEVLSQSSSRLQNPQLQMEEQQIIFSPPKTKLQDIQHVQNSEVSNIPPKIIKLGLGESQKAKLKLPNSQGQMERPRCAVIPPKTKQEQILISHQSNEQSPEIEFMRSKNEGDNFGQSHQTILRLQNSQRQIQRPQIECMNPKTRLYAQILNTESSINRGQFECMVTSTTACESSPEMENTEPLNQMAQPESMHSKTINYGFDSQPTIVQRQNGTHLSQKQIIENKYPSVEAFEFATCHQQTDQGMQISEPQSLNQAEVANSTQKNPLSRRSSAKSYTSVGDSDSASNSESCDSDQDQDENILLQNNMVIFGNGPTEIHKKDFDTIDWKNGRYGLALRKLLRMVFPVDILASHSLTGKPSPAFVGRKKDTRPQLDPVKVQDIVRLVARKFSLPENIVKATVTTALADAKKTKVRMNMKSNQNKN